MDRKTHMDAFGATALVLFAANLGFNQVVIKVTNGGFQPVFSAGLRSAGAIVILLLWMKLRGTTFRIDRAAVPAGLLSGVFFAVEFMALFTALDLTTVGRASVMLYSMPVWLALASHLVIPGERLTKLRTLGMALAMGGVALALLDRSSAGASLAGDLLALVAAFCWTGIALCVKITPLSRVAPVHQLMYQLVVSAPVLLLAALFFGDLVRDIGPVHLAGLAYQIVCVASLGFLAWFWLLSIYPAASVASFSFLSPVFAVLLGWALLGEEIAPRVWIALGLVAAGIFLVNRRPRAVRATGAPAR
ncbi:DMT family transporter [Sulfitobacter sp. D35]|uniref:DMT family transporter n=1 Tax=Sulfitobacter sp. D35 TaxID=3083252 RepID=UPI00296E8B97|nr:DMT family transporter [Sulfitobacter sp. D35]MDW4497607.1 DMT family transporter [Sulfitobacter sp. D35]